MSLVRSTPGRTTIKGYEIMKYAEKRTELKKLKKGLNSKGRLNSEIFGVVT